MRVFEGFNKASNCPICGTNKEGKAVLIPINGTSDGNISEAEQVHLDCFIKQEFQLYACEDGIIIATKTGGKKCEQK